MTPWQIVSFLMVVLITAAAPGASRPPGLDLRLSFEGRVVQEQFHRAQTGGLDVGAFFHQRLGPSLEADVEAVGRLQTGAYEAAFIDEYGAQQNLVLREASMTWRPVAPLAICWGVLPHETLPTLIHDKAFTGISQLVQLEEGPLRLSLAAEQSLASSPSRTLFPSFSSGKMPLFMRERAEVAYGRESLRASAHVGHFSFLNLSREVEYRSRFFGNSGSGNTRENASLAYTFHGVEIGGEVEFRMGHLRPSLRWNAHRNLDPPQGLNEALLAQLGLEYQWSASFVSGVTLLGFHIESDAGPAFYSNKFLGHNNRRGLGASLHLEFSQTPLRVELGYVNAERIDASAFQSRFQQGFVLFETAYDLL